MNITSIKRLMVSIVKAEAFVQERKIEIEKWMAKESTSDDRIAFAGFQAQVVALAANLPLFCTASEAARALEGLHPASTHLGVEFDKGRQVAELTDPIGQTLIESQPSSTRAEAFQHLRQRLVNWYMGADALIQAVASKEAELVFDAHPTAHPPSKRGRHEITFEVHGGELLNENEYRANLVHHLSGNFSMTVQGVEGRGSSKAQAVDSLRDALEELHADQWHTVAASLAASLTPSDPT